MGLFKLLKKYSPETRTEKNARLLEQAKVKNEGQAPKDSKKPVVLKFGLNHITTLIEEKKAKLVVIANDVDPIELVLWLPLLCRKQEVAFCFVKSSNFNLVFVYCLNKIKKDLENLSIKKLPAVLLLLKLEKRYLFSY